MVIEPEAPDKRKCAKGWQVTRGSPEPRRTSLHKSASVLLALAPLLEPPAALTDALSTLVAEFADFEARLEHLTLRLLSQRPRREVDPLQGAGVRYVLGVPHADQRRCHPRPCGTPRHSRL